MNYFREKSDLNFMSSFRQSVYELLKIEKEAIERLDSGYRSEIEYQAALQAEASKIPGYQEVREQVAKGVLRAEGIATRMGVPIIFESYPAPAVGGPVIRQKVFSSIFMDFSHGGQITKQTILDAINQTIGACENSVALEFRHLINPLYWIKMLVVTVIRIPFMVAAASGFDVSKVEEHFIGRFFKLLEIVAIIYILLRLGIEKENIRQILIKLF